MQQLLRKPVESGVWSLDPKGSIRYVRIMYTDHLSLTTEAFQETIWIPQSSLVTIYLLKASQPASQTQDSLQVFFFGLPDWLECNDKAVSLGVLSENNFPSCSKRE
jgi:hypothetical protein